MMGMKGMVSINPIRFQGVFLCEFNKESGTGARSGKNFSERKDYSTKEMVA